MKDKVDICIPDEGDVKRSWWHSEDALLDDECRQIKARNMMVQRALPVPVGLFHQNFLRRVATCEVSNEQALTLIDLYLLVHDGVDARERFIQHPDDPDAQKRFLRWTVAPSFRESTLSTVEEADFSSRSAAEHQTGYY